jgi:hypothetical protein
MKIFSQRDVTISRRIGDLLSLRQAFNAGVAGYFGVFAVGDIHAHHPETALLDFVLAAGVIFWARHMDRGPSL